MRTVWYATCHAFAQVRGVSDDEALMWLSQHATMLGHDWWQVQGSEAGMPVDSLTFPGIEIRTADQDQDPA